jgi:hypothetical protein
VSQALPVASTTTWTEVGRFGVVIEVMSWPVQTHIKNANDIQMNHIQHLTVSRKSKNYDEKLEVGIARSISRER